jgi:hypothetical protein
VCSSDLIEYSVVVVTDVPDACEVFLAMDDAEETSDDCEELCASYLQIADDHDLDEDEYWSVMFTVNTNDGAVGGFDYADLADETDEFTAIYSRLDARDLVDQATCESACEDQELLTSEDELPDDGSLELEEVDDEQLPGTFTLEFGGTDLLEGSFDADPCDVEELL